MALTEKQEYNVEVVPPYQILQVRRDDVIIKDDVEISRTFHRHVVMPGDDVSAEPTVVQQIAGAVIASATWTPAVVAAYAASLTES